MLANKNYHRVAIAYNLVAQLMKQTTNAQIYEELYAYRIQKYNKVSFVKTQLIFTDLVIYIRCEYIHRNVCVCVRVCVRV